MRFFVCLALLLPTVARADWDELKKMYEADAGMAEMQRWEALRNQEQMVREMRRINKNLEKLAEERGEQRGWRHEGFGSWDEPVGVAPYVLGEDYDSLGDDWAE